MLSQKYRFHSRGGVNYVRQHGHVVRSISLTLTILPNSRGHRRFAVVVSKKVLKSAVGRNRIRRRFYEAIRLESPESLPPVDCIFSVYNSNFLQLPFRDLRRAVRELLDRAIASFE